MSSRLLIVRSIVARLQHSKTSRKETDVNNAKAIEGLYRINELYQDIEIVLGDRPDELTDGTTLKGPLSDKEKLERIKVLNNKIGAITGPWI